MEMTPAGTGTVVIEFRDEVELAEHIAELMKLLVDRQKGINRVVSLVGATPMPPEKKQAGGATHFTAMARFYVARKENR